MRKKVGIIVEVINREMDNAILLKEALKYNGFNAKIYFKTENYAFRKNDILIIPNSYNTENYNFYRYRFKCKSGNMIDMQYEQVFRKVDENADYLKIKGRAQDILHLCWGENSYIRANQLYGVAKENLSIVGPIQFDHTREEFKKNLYTKSELAEKYKLPIDKKWILFISSFTSTEDNVFVENAKIVVSEDRTLNYQNLSRLSKNEIVKWFDKFLFENPDYILIYRPHPVELSSQIVKELKERHNNFLCISDYSVKQWIYSCDIVTTWFSTSIFESYYMKKNCLIFRPIDFNENEDYELYVNCNKISNYDEFVKGILDYNADITYFPINVSKINYFYNFDIVPTYVRIIDEIKKNSNVIKKEKNYSLHRFKYELKNKNILKDIIKKIYSFMFKKFNFKINNAKLRNKFFIEEWEKSAKNPLKSKKYIKERTKEYKQIVIKYYN